MTGAVSARETTPCMPARSLLKDPPASRPCAAADGRPACAGNRREHHTDGLLGNTPRAPLRHGTDQNADGGFSAHGSSQATCAGPLQETLQASVEATIAAMRDQPGQTPRQADRMLADMLACEQAGVPLPHALAVAIRRTATWARQLQLVLKEAAAARHGHGHVSAPLARKLALADERLTASVARLTEALSLSEAGPPSQCADEHGAQAEQTAQTAQTPGHGISSETRHSLRENRKVFDASGAAKPAAKAQGGSPAKAARELEPPLEQATAFFTGELTDANLLEPSSPLALLVAMTYLMQLHDRSPELQQDACLSAALAEARPLVEHAICDDPDAPPPEPALLAGIRVAAAELHELGWRYMRPGMPHLLASIYRLLETPDHPEALAASLRATMRLLAACEDQGVPVPRELTEALSNLRGPADALRFAAGHLERARRDEDADAEAAAEAKIRQAGDVVRSSLPQLAAAAEPAWQTHFARPDKLSADFDRLHACHLGTNRVNYRWRELKMSGHVASAKVSTLGLWTCWSETMRGVMKGNESHLEQARQGAGRSGAAAREQLLSQLTPKLLDAVKRYIGEAVRNAFSTNLNHTLRKAGGGLANSLREAAGREARALDKSRAEVIANLLNLKHEESRSTRRSRRWRPTSCAMENPSPR